MTSLAVIPARGGSRRIPRKNIRPFLGRPIISYVIQAARACGAFSEVMVSTDDDEIARIALEHGATLPFRRSVDTSGDHATTLAVLREVIDGYTAAGRSFDALCCIYPTAVLTRPETLRGGWELLKASPDAGCVLPVVSYPHPAQRALVIRDGRLRMLQPEHAQIRTQDLEQTYHDAGQWYWLRPAALRDRDFRLLGPAAVPVVLGPMDAQDIDTVQDWDLAEAKFRLQQQGGSQ